MKYAVTKFKNLSVALKEIEPLIRDGHHLLKGKPFKKFGQMRSREILGNWLVCAVVNENEGNEFHTFTTDPQGGDGVIVNLDTNASWPTEHVIAIKLPSTNEQDVTNADRIIKAFNDKFNKGGAAYANGKQLIIFLESSEEEWKPRLVARQLPKSLGFADVWVFGLLSFDNNAYTYFVSQLGTPEREAPTWKVQIEQDFNSWHTSRIQ